MTFFLIHISTKADCLLFLTKSCTDIFSLGSSLGSSSGSSSDSSSGSSSGSNLEPPPPCI